MLRPGKTVQAACTDCEKTPEFSRGMLKPGSWGLGTTYRARSWAPMFAFEMFCPGAKLFGLTVISACGSAKVGEQARVNTKAENKRVAGFMVETSECLASAASDLLVRSQHTRAAARHALVPYP